MDPSSNVLLWTVWGPVWGKAVECFLITIVEGRPALQLARRRRFSVHSALRPADRHVRVVRVEPRTRHGEQGPPTEAAWIAGTEEKKCGFRRITVGEEWRSNDADQIQGIVQYHKSLFCFTTVVLTPHGWFTLQDYISRLKNFIMKL